MELIIENRQYRYNIIILIQILNDTNQRLIFVLTNKLKSDFFMKSFYTLIFLFITITKVLLPQNFNSNEFYHSYPNYKDSNIKNKRFSHSEIIKKIKEIKKFKSFNVEVAGKSIEGRNIFLVSIGEGKTNVLLWSQMHGDESTATMALFDIFNFFNADDSFNNFRKQILKKLNIYFIPMLNPDGAENFKRRNALNIDLNRDALRLQFPESRILKSVRDSLKPKFAFNLHDQNTRYTAGNSYHSATISFLAPAYNYEKEINTVRGNTMKIIVDMYNELNKFIPGHIAKYKDDFEPRAFGDNLVKWGTSSVLIESGGWKNDKEKQFIRKLNYISILSGLHSIANKTYEKVDIEVYNNIPFNDNLLFDVLLRNLTIKHKKKSYIVDVGINREEKSTIDQTQHFYHSKVEDWGDLSIFYGYEEIDLTGYELRKSMIYDLQIENLDELDIIELLKEGYGFIRLDSLEINREFSSLPFNLVLGDASINLKPEYGEFANFTIWKNKKIRYNVINGFVYDVKSEIEINSHGLIFK